MTATLSLALVLLAQASPYPNELAYLPELLKRNGEVPLGSGQQRDFMRFVGMSAFGYETVIRAEIGSKPPTVVLKVRCPGILPEEGEDLPLSSDGQQPEAQRREDPPPCKAGSMIVDHVAHLSPAQLNAINKLAESVLWKRPYRAPRRPQPNEVVIFDGTAWVVEGQRRGQTHLVRQWSPEDPVFCELIRLLVAGRADFPIGDCDRK